MSHSLKAPLTLTTQLSRGDQMRKILDECGLLLLIGQMGGGTSRPKMTKDMSQIINQKEW